MKLILILEIIFLILKNATSNTCNFPFGLQVYELGAVNTLSCSELKLGIQFNKNFRNFTKSKSFYRVICDENGDMIMLYPKLNVLVFCADIKCLLPNSVLLSTNLSQHFNGSVVATVDLQEVYYCMDSKWYSLFQTVLPKELENLNKENKIIQISSTIKPWSVVGHLDIWKLTYNDLPKEKYILPSINKSYIGNYSNFIKLKLKQTTIDNIDLCGIAIICSIICSFFLFITIVLILSSKFVQKHQIRRKFIEANSIIADSKIHLEKEKLSNKNNKVEISCIVDKCESTVESKETEYTTPSKSSKDLEASSA